MESAPPTAAALDVSVVIPVFDEEESVPALLRELHGALRPTGLRYELVLVDDGSRDRSVRVMKDAAATDPALVVVELRRNFGQTAALQAGLDEARGAKVVLMDADLQNDPADIPRMLALLDDGYDLVAGWRKDRQDPFLNRRLPSMIANRIISSTTGVHLHDYGCTLKAMTSSVAKSLRLYGEMHRFIPAIASWFGTRLIELPVNHRARQHGVSKYGIGRTLRVVLDLITVRFMQSYLTRPMQVFGLGGLASAALGFGLCLYLAVEKLVFSAPIGSRPLLLLGVLLIVVGVQLISLGLVADVLSRTYHESQGKRPYHVRAVLRGPGAGAAPAGAEE
ncbi:MAG: glycosyltransferase family 2 protein [Polyangiaceae bacterium]|nr:glycosyltransferase family 2 protein [Polyangiaceae bacterium]